jgi:hypothetical protein
MVTWLIAALLTVVLVGLPAAASVSARRQPRTAWVAVGRSRERWLAAFLLWFFGVGELAAMAYVALVRPKLRREPRPTPLEPGTRVIVAEGPLRGWRGTVSRARGVMRLQSRLGRVLLRRDGEKRLIAVDRDVVVVDVGSASSEVADSADRRLLVRNQRAANLASNPHIVWVMALFAAWAGIRVVFALRTGNAGLAALALTLFIPSGGLVGVGLWARHRERHDRPRH